MLTNGRSEKLTGLFNNLSSRRLCSTRSRISLEALLVKVIARIFSGAIPVLTKCRILSVIVLVLPAPAPAKIKTGPCVVPTAFFCSELRFSEGLDMLDTIAYEGTMG